MLQHPKSTPTKLDNDGPTVPVVEDSGGVLTRFSHPVQFIDDCGAQSQLRRPPARCMLRRHPMQSTLFGLLQPVGFECLSISQVATSGSRYHPIAESIGRGA